MSNKKLILLVEDEAVISLATSQKLKKFGYDVLTVNTGEKALAFIQEHVTIDLVLMDINLGSGIDGIETASKILQIKNIPIVFLTSHIEPEYLQKAKSITPYGYVLKNSTDFVLQYAIDMAFQLFQAFQQTKQSEERLTKFIQSAVNGYVFLDKELRVIDINTIALQAGNAIPSYTHTNAIGVSVLDIFPFLNYYTRELQLGYQQIKFEKNILIPNRSLGPAWIHISIFPVSHGLGMVIQDITLEKLISDTQVFLSQKGWSENEENFFKSLIKFLCIELDLEIGILGEISGKEAHTLSFFHAGVIQENISYNLEGTPCEDLLHTHYVCYTENIQSQFPDNSYLSQFRLNSYIGISLWNTDNELVGFLAFLSKKSIRKPDWIRTVLQMVSGRVAGEIERAKAKEMIALEKKRLEGYLNLTQSILLVINEQGNIVLANKQACILLEYETNEILGKHFTELLLPEEKKYVSEQLEKLLQSEGNIDIENYILSQTGKKRLVSWHYMIFQEQNVKYILSSGEDITEKRKQEWIFEEREKRLKNTFEHTPIPITITRLQDGKIITANQLARKLFSFDTLSPKEAVSSSIDIWTSLEERNRFIQTLTSELNVFRYPAKMQNRFQQAFQVYLNATIIELKGEPHIISVIEDINIENEKWRDVVTTNDFLQSILNSSFDVIFIKDIHLRYVLCNAKYTEIVDKGIEDILGKTDIEIGWDIDTVKGNKEKNIIGFETEDLNALHGEIIRSPSAKVVFNGVVRYYDTVKIPLRDNNQQIMGILGIAREVTEQKQAEEELLKSEALFRAFFEQTAVGVAQINSITGEFIRVNKKYTEIIGYSLEELQHMNFMEISHPDELEADLAWMDKLIMGETHDYVMDKRLFKKNGQTIWVKLAVSSAWTFSGKSKYHIAVIEDITNQKVEEINLLDSKKLYQSIVHASPAAIGVVSLSWEMMLASDKLLQLFGFSSEHEVIEKPISTWIEKSFYNDAMLVFEEAAQKKYNIETHICVFRKKNGKTFTGKVAINPLLDEKGEPSAFLVFVTDISQELAYEAKLKEIHHFMDALLNMSPNAIFVYDLLARKNIYTNNGMQKMLGYRTGVMDDFKTDTLKKIMHPDDYSFFMREIYPKYSDFDTNDILTYEYRILNHQNQWLWFRAKELVFSRTQDGTPKEILGVIENISDWKDKELILKENEAFFNNAISESNVSFWSCTSIGSSINLWYSPHMYELLGYEVDEVSAYDVIDLMHEDDKAKNNEKFRLSLLNKGKYQNEYRLKTKQGHYKWFSVTGKIEMEQEYSFKMVGTIVDIDAQKEIGIILQNLLEEKDLLLHEVHHRIKNNMSTIISLLQLQSTEIKNQDTVESFSTAINRIRSMMLLYDKLYQSTNVSVIQGKEYLEELTYEVISEFPNHVNLHIEIDDFIVESNIMSSLGMIINEVITNAMKYAFKDISNPILSLQVSNQGSCLVLNLSDNGIGLPEHIDFEKKTGFGLKFVQLLCTQIRAQVQIIRKQGTSFIIQIPL